MEKGFDEERWLLANNSVVNIDDDGEEEEETLSFVDLPQTQLHSETTQVEEKRSISQEIQEDFNFCRSFSLKSEMCTADEVFFQGQIIPLRHSVSSEKRLLPSRSVSRSDSMDRYYYSNGLFSSRSSSNSSSSYSWSGNGNMSVSRNGSVNSLVNQQRGSHPKPPRNQFHSHPSPSPRIHNQGVLNYNPSNTKNCTKKSPMWSIFRLGLVTPPPEIVFQDFKTRVPNKRSNSRNSNSSGSSVKEKEKEKKKKKRALFGASCKCSADVVDTVTSKIVKDGNESVIKSKKEMSHHRTFEWLKQLSLEAAAAAREEA